ncbi:suppressor of Under-Replication [Haematobia irritans]|uniref:suppressor of Under-Replication n=1 Tax=Haematobia irritans TaxID=7368 RepID=UPI003F4FB1BF
MYHFVADHPPVPVRLSFRAQIPGHVRQYLKQFQIDACIFMHNFLAKGEFCAYNDEGGLGKQAAVAVLLDTACGNKKTLIIVQNDDNYVIGWEFHFSVLTNCNTKVIKDNKDTIDSPHNVYIAKWSTLRALDDLSKFDFDYVIVDNRGQMLNNTFCMSMLLKHYERKVNILISSVDITSDLKLLHNILKLGGRLDPRYTNFKQFEEKFKLPDARELTYKRVDLEEYFLKRERLSDYCKNFRIRRYCHQYENQLPLVEPDRYKINLEIYREKQNATNSESSSVEISSQNRQEERVRDTQELFEEYCRQRRKQQELEKQKLEKQNKETQLQLILEEQEKQQKEREKQDALNDDDEVAFINETLPVIVAKDKQSNTADNTDEAIVMSPLLLVSDSEDTDDVPQICNDPSDDDNIVDLSSDGENETSFEKDSTAQTSQKEKLGKASAQTQSPEKGKKVPKKKEVRKMTEFERLRADVATNLKFQNETTPKRRSRNVDHNQQIISDKKRGNDENGKVIAKDKDTGNNGKEGKQLKSKNNIKTNINKENELKDSPKTPQTSDKSKATGAPNKASTEKTLDNDSTPRKHKSLQTPQKTGGKDITQETATTPRESRTNRRVGTDSDRVNTTTSPMKAGKSPVVTRNKSPGDANKSTGPTTPIVVIKTEPEESTPQSKRSLPSKDISNTIQRIKRELNIEHVVIHNRETRSAKRLTRSAGCPNKNIDAAKNSLFSNDKAKPKKSPLPKHDAKRETEKRQNDSQSNKSSTIINDSQVPVISMTCSQDYDPIQCAQRLSDVSNYDSSNTQRKASEFLIPATPVSTRNSLIPSSLMSSNGFFGDSEVIFVPPTPVASTSGKKSNKKTDDVIVLSESDTESTSVNYAATSRRTRALKPRRAAQQQQMSEESGKVPTFSQLLAQHNTRTSAKSPDLFSNCSDLAQLPCSQKDNADETNAPFEGFKIFGSEVKQLQQHYASSNTQNTSNKSGKKSSRERSCLDILENMFEPPNKKQKHKNSKNNEGTPTLSHATTSNSNDSPSRRNKQRAKNNGPIVPHHPIEAIAEAQKAQQEKLRTRSLGSSVLEDEIFEITNNGTFGSVMRLHSNGEISPVQQAQKSTQNNKITKYFQGGLTQNLTGSQEDSGNNSEAGTPSKTHQQQTCTQPANTKKSPKVKCNTTQVTKLTKWFTKNTPSKQMQTQVGASKSDTSSLKTLSASKRIVKRRRLDMTRVRDDSD